MPLFGSFETLPLVHGVKMTRKVGMLGIGRAGLITFVDAAQARSDIVETKMYYIILSLLPY